MNRKIIPNIGHALNFSQRIKVVDIGALPDGRPTPYYPLLAAGYADIVGFEPNPFGLDRLNSAKGEHETYLPYIIGDGKRHTLHFFGDAGMTSLLPPNDEVLQLYNIFQHCSTLTGTEEVDTVRLDDIPEAALFDYLKIDIQGAELMVFENATEQLKNAVIVHTEVEFLPLYVGQPLFADIDRFFNQRGFRLHSFSHLATNSMKPLLITANPYMGFGHVLYGDAVFIRDIVNLAPMSSDQLLKLAIILHDCYHSYDVALRLLTEYDSRLKTSHARYYLNMLKGEALVTS